MYTSFGELFLLSFLVISCLYGVLASLTRILYRNKLAGQLNNHELRVKQGTASLDNRLNLFVRAFFGSFFTWQVYVMALAISGAGYLAGVLLQR